MQPTIFQLNDEHRSRIRDCLWKQGIRLSHEADKNFARDVECSIVTFLKERGNSSTTHREAHDALRAVWQISQQDDVLEEQLRALLNALPRRAIEYLDTRARQVIPRQLETAYHGFLEWAKHADAEGLVHTIRLISSDGAKRVSRSRGGGKRSSGRVEPLIFGKPRGAGDRAPGGGRRSHHARDALVVHLAIDWALATNSEPLPGRSDRSGFGDLVHSVFQWLDEPSPDQALRRYWSAVKECRSPSASAGSRPSS